MDAVRYTSLSDRISLDHQNECIIFRLSPPMVSHLRDALDGFESTWDLEERASYHNLTVPCDGNISAIKDACKQLAHREDDLHDHPPSDSRVRNALLRLHYAVHDAQQRGALSGIS